jgi:hypothetical protein
MHKHNFSIRESWSSDDDVSFAFADLASKKCGIEYSDRSLFSCRVDKSNVIYFLLVSEADIFFGDVSSGRNCCLSISYDFIEIFDTRSVFVCPRKIEQQIFDIFDAILAE